MKKISETDFYREHPIMVLVIVAILSFLAGWFLIDLLTPGWD